MNFARLRKLREKYAIPKKVDGISETLEGARAFARGQTPADCPYPIGTKRQMGWWTGWSSMYDRRFRPSF
jgi:hypothetical protein